MEPKTDKYLRDCRASIETSLRRYLKKRNGESASRLYQAVCYSALDGGKRFRPILTLAVGELFGAKRQALLPFACAVEMIHCYSLIHDDLPALDNDDLRRGKPSCHKRFGEATALLAGDALLTEAFFIMSDPKTSRLLGGATIVRLIREVSGAAGIRGMIRGQSAELELAGRRVTPATLENLDRLKTGMLIAAAARVGAIIGNAGARDLGRITRYARALGLAFQITDDILDRDEVSRGNGKATVNYLSLTEPAKARERIRRLLGVCLREMRPYGGAAEPLREIARYVASRAEPGGEPTNRIAPLRTPPRAAARGGAAPAPRMKRTA